MRPIIFKLQDLRRKGGVAPLSAWLQPLGNDGLFVCNWQAVVDHTGTAVNYLGKGVHTIEKVAPGTGPYDAGAVSSAAVTGDFVLRLRHIAATSGYGAGVNSDPLSDDSYTSIDNLWIGGASALWTIYESGGAIAGPFANNGYAWIWRVGSVLGYGRGPDLATAKASPDRLTTSTGPLYFDSTLSVQGDEFEALFFSFVTYDETLSEDAPAGDLVDAVALFASPLAESLVASDVVDAVATFASARAESVAAAEALASTATFPAVLSETVAAVDSIAGGLLLSATLSEAVAAAFSPVVVATFNSALSEGVTSAAAQASAATFVSSLSEGVTAAAAQSSAATFPNALAEGVTAAAAQTSAAIFNSALAEGVTASDSDGAVATFSNVLAESATVGVVLVDQLISGGTIYNVSLTETVVASAAFGLAGEIKAFDGAVWQQHPARAWNGARWAIKPVKVWDGAGWVLS